MAFDVGISIGLEGVSQYTNNLKKVETQSDQTFSNVGKGVDGVRTSFRSLAEDLPIIGDGLRFISNPLGAVITGLTGGVAAISSFVNSAAQFETVSIQFETLIGDAEKAQATLQGLSTFAAGTPFQFQDIADAGRSLLAFGTEADDLENTLRRLGDISAGVGAPLGEIAEIYGKVQVQGRLFAEDINQLTGRGIPVIQELAKQFGVADSEVKELVESGQVGFPEIEKAFISLTDEGGKFAGLTEALAGSLEGQLSTLRDSFALIGRDIGELFLPAVSSAVGLIQDLVSGLGDIPEILSENTEIIGIAAGALVLFNSNAILLGLQSIPNLVTSLLASSKGFLAVAANSNIAIGAQALYITGSQLLKGTITAATAAQRVFNIVFAANPVALIATGVIALASALFLFKDNTEEAAKVSQDFSQIQGKISAGYTKERAALDALFKPLRDNAASNQERSNAITAINEQYKDYLPNLITEKSSAEDLAIAYEAVNRAIIDNITTKAIQERAASVLQKITEVEIDRATKLLELEKEINAEVANGGVASGFNLREIEIQASAGQSLDDLFGELEAIDEAGAAIGESLQNSLSGIDFSNIFSATKKTVEGLGGAEKAAKTLADQLSELGVSLPAFEEFGGLTELSDQTEEVKEKANEAREAIVALGEEPNASVSVLKDQISNLRQAISLLPPEAAGIRAITDEVVRLELQLLEAEKQIERTFLATKIDAVEFEVIAKVTDFDIPEPPLVEVPVDFVPITNPFTSLEGAADVLGTDVEFLNDRFRDTGELLDLMGTNSFKFFSKFLEDIEDGIDFTLLWKEALLQIGKEVLFQVGDAFEVLGQGIGSALATPIETTDVLREKLAAINTALATVPPDSGVADSLNQQKEAIESQLDSAAALRGQYDALKLSMESLPKDSEAFKIMESQANSLEKQLGILEGTTGRFSSAFSSFVDALLDTVLVAVPKMLGLFLLQSSLALSFPAGVPFAIAGLALVGLSGLAKGLLAQNVEIQDTVLGGFSAPNLDSTSVPTGPSLATDQQSAFGLSDLNQDQGQVTNVTVMFGQEDVTDFFSIAFQTEKELTG